jgi:hypothetical protein
MKETVFLLTILVTLMAGCGEKKNASDKIMEEFKKVDGSLRQSNKALANDTTGGYSPILIRLRWQGDEVVAYMDSLKNILLASGEDDLTAPETLMLSQKQGGILYGKLHDFTSAALDGVVGSDSVAAEINDLMQPFVSDADNKEKRNWAKKNFERLPVAAAVTLLSKFENDVRNCIHIAKLGR